MSKVHIEGLHKSYGKKEVLKDLNLDLEKGKIYGLLAQNGEGKTTLMKILAGVAVKEFGTVEIDELTPGKETKQHTVYLPEHSALDPSKSCAQMMKMMADFFEDFDADQARELLVRLGLDENQKLSSMSKGMQEKAALALALARSADLYLLDEPLGGVDPASREQILKTILSSYRENASLLISTHLIADVEAILDEVLFMKNGRIILQEAADEMRMRTGESIERNFRKEFAPC
ncbi:MAG: ABC transporter ATP-binding protein [Erysipelotrichaceae bacterium]|nr:ABC transporter ATP-binding protein [Erysipelotrichaceae bacterium]